MRVAVEWPGLCGITARNLYLVKKVTTSCKDNIKYLNNLLDRIYSYHTLHVS
jgi:hypothetical protein